MSNELMRDLYTRNQIAAFISYCQGTDTKASIKLLDELCEEWDEFDKKNWVPTSDLTERY